MANTLVGSASAAAGSVTLPAHQTGDLIFIFGRASGSSIPTTPSGFTQINADTNGVDGYNLAYKVAASSSETSGSWAATHTIAHVYRNTLSTGAIGGSTIKQGFSTGINYDTVTLGVTDGTSWIASFGIAHSSTLALETPPTGETLRQNITGTSVELASFDTNGGVSSFTSRNTTVASGVDYLTISVEIKAGLTPITGTLAVTEADDTVSSASKVAISGTATVTEANDTVSGLGAHTSLGSLTATEADDTVAASGYLRGDGFVGAASTATSAAVTMPSHQTGDLILAFAFRKGSPTPPSLPSGFTSIRAQQESGGGSSFRLGYKIAASGSETSGNWTNATSLAVQVYRNVSDSPIGGNAWSDGTTSSIIYPGVTLADADGSSWVATFAGISINTSTIEAPPTGQVLRTNATDATNGEIAGFDTNGGITSWADQTIGIGASGSSLTVSVEIKCRINAHAAVTEADDTLSATAIGPNGSLAITEANDTVSAAGVASLSGSLAITEANDTVSSAAAIALKATGAVTEADDSVSGAGALAVHGTLTQTEADDSVSAVGVLSIKGTETVTEADDAISAAGVLAVKATLAQTEAGDTVAATGTLPIVASAAITEADDTVTSTTLGSHGTLSVTEADDSTTTTGRLAIVGSLAVSEAGDTVSGAGALLISALLAQTEAGDTVSGSATLPIHAAASVTEADDSLAGTGAISARGSLAITEADDTVSGSGTLPIKATLAQTEASDTVSAAGTLPIVGTLSQTEASDTISAAGTLPLYGTLAVTEANDTVAGFGGASLTGHLTETEAGDTVSAVGKLPIVGALAQTEAGDTLSANGASTTLGSLAVTESDDTVSGSAKILINGSLAVTEESDTANSDSFTAGFKVKRYNGSSWDLKPMKMWTGTAWVPVPRNIIRIYTGGDPTNVANWPHLYP